MRCFYTEFLHDHSPGGNAAAANSAILTADAIPPVHAYATKRSTSFEMLLYGIRQRPILPGRVQPSTFGTEGLNCCVRNGNRWNPFVIATGNGELFTLPVACASRLSHCSTFSLPCQALAFVPAPSSAGAFPHPDNCTSNDSTSDRFPISLIFVLRSPEATKHCNQALDLLVSSSCMCYHTSTDDLSTW